MDDLFANLRPVEPVKVPVGHETLFLEEATMAQQNRLLQEVQKLENLGDVLTNVAQLIQGAGDDADDEDQTAGFLSRLVEIAPALWESARKLLGKEFVPAVRAAVAIMLNTERNAKALGFEDGQRDSHGVWAYSKGLDKAIQEGLILRQATYILGEIWRVNRYTEALGNLLPLTLTTVEGPGEEETIN